MTLQLFIHFGLRLPQSEEWPFTWFCEEMFRNLFNPSWEVSLKTVTCLCECLCFLFVLFCLFVCLLFYWCVCLIVCLLVYWCVCLFVCSCLFSLYIYFFAVELLCVYYFLLLLTCFHVYVNFFLLSQGCVSTVLTRTLVLLSPPGSSRGSHNSERDHQVTWRDCRHLCIHSTRQGSISLVLKPQAHVLS